VKKLERCAATAQGSPFEGRSNRLPRSWIRNRSRDSDGTDFHISEEVRRRRPDRVGEWRDRRRHGQPGSVRQLQGLVAAVTPPWWWTFLGVDVPRFTPWACSWGALKRGWGGRRRPLRLVIAEPRILKVFRDQQAEPRCSSITRRIDDGRASQLSTDERALGDSGDEDVVELSLPVRADLAVLASSHAATGGVRASIRRRGDRRPAPGRRPSFASRCSVGTRLDACALCFERRPAGHHRRSAALHQDAIASSGAAGCSSAVKTKVRSRSGFSRPSSTSTATTSKVRNRGAWLRKRRVTESQ